MSRPFPERGRGDRGPIRHDLEPLLKRFSVLGEPLEATWQGGALDTDVPIGPSLVWIEGVVRLAPGVAKDLARDTGASATEAPAVPEELRSALTDGPWLAGEELSRSFKGMGYAGKVFLDVDDDVVVFLTVGRWE